jgi:hypothetical protein
MSIMNEPSPAATRASSRPIPDEAPVTTTAGLSEEDDMGARYAVRKSIDVLLEIAKHAAEMTLRGIVLASKDATSPVELFI